MFDQRPSLQLLFDQLGLASEQAAIDQFVKTNQIAQGTSIQDAEFWSESQKTFIAKHWRKDDNWSLVIDELSELLSQRATNQSL